MRPISWSTWLHLHHSRAGGTGCWDRHTNTSRKVKSPERHTLTPDDVLLYNVGQAHLARRTSEIQPIPKWFDRAIALTPIRARGLQGSDLGVTIMLQ
ncbi:hypothetical protein L226DRAFT_541154 [Lentinus tigrinus ALCF2SS1-7]|uniref:uncharacterized protein n=1 Tax=Lentinus tigrinus ALCF2SS1-7 TaxID=1328758 RepID=UPI0011663859|nr:hypothetical protein L226DRAFT_541171 [Lentinus tigrinus ALCF2SS1-7]RPD67849.1 hypothetical protein L226DRAFT_541154 [Lentinus tigrinus ALCF2SS1-7]